MFIISISALPAPGGGMVEMRCPKKRPVNGRRSTGVGIRARSSRRRKPPWRAMSASIAAAIPPV